MRNNSNCASGHLIFKVNHKRSFYASSGLVFSLISCLPSTTCNRPQPVTKNLKRRKKMDNDSKRKAYSKQSHHTLYCRKFKTIIALQRTSSSVYYCYIDSRSSAYT